MALDQLRATPHDVMVVAAYGLLLPQQVLERAPYGCLNIHASLLPRWRGAAPVHRAIEAGDRETGITLMQMDSGLDTGPMIAAQRVPIDPTDTTATLTDKLAALGAQMIVDALVTLECNSTLPAVPQRSEDACYAAKIAKHEAWLDWRRPASELARRVRAFDPFPGASVLLDGVLLKCWAATASEAHPDSPLPGTIVDINPKHVAIACGTGTLQVTECQKPGGRRLPTHEFITGFPFCCGQRFALPPQPSR
jgi:methionyl-tRNA formyltransferase